MNLNEIAEDIKNIIDNKRAELALNFVEDTHTYYMLDEEGNIRTDYPSVTKIIKKFYDEFDSEGIAEHLAKGSKEKKESLLTKWKKAGDHAVNLGNRVHYKLETSCLELFGVKKNVREPLYECDGLSIKRSDKMIAAGLEYLSLMKERGAVLLDTEMVIGHPQLGYVGQPDKVWLVESKDKKEFGICITDWKTNQEKSFKVNSYTKKLKTPFTDIDDNSLGHYYLQLPLYGKLILKMLEDTKYNNIKLLGCIIVHLKDDETFTEYRIPNNIIKRVLSHDL